MFSLLSKPWLPVHLSDGNTAWIRPAEIASPVGGQVITGFAWERPDFDAAAREFMIGLLSTACAGRLEDTDTWSEWLDTPPDALTLDKNFASLAPYFELDGPDARFLQDSEAIAGEGIPIGQLLIDAPGANTLKKNLDHFVHRDRVVRLSRAAAAMALYTLQTFAPTGGQGHFVGLRGGGPLSTLVFPTPDGTSPLLLWTCLWLNAVPLDSPRALDTRAHAAQVFPWAGPTRTSEAGQTINSENTMPAHAFWGMPRRIRLQFSSNTDRLPCDLTGLVDETIVTAFSMRTNGLKYSFLEHPLSPYYRTKASSMEWLAVHPQPERLGYRHWLGLVLGDDDAGKGLRKPAAVVQVANKRLKDFPAAQRPGRLIAAGFDMDNMKARGFVESEMPVYPVDHDRADRMRALARHMIESADLAARALAGELRNALAHGGDGSSILAVRRSLWDETEDRFYRTIEALATMPEGGQYEADQFLMRSRVDWHAALVNTALRLFDRTVPLDEIGMLRTSQMHKLVKARDGLQKTLNIQVRKAAGVPIKQKETGVA